MAWSAATVTAIAASVAAASAVGTTAYTIAQGSPGQPDLSALASKPPGAPEAPIVPPPAAPDTSIETEEQKARQRAAKRIRDLASRQSAPSTVLSAPLGISAPATSGAQPTTLLGR